MRCFVALAALALALALGPGGCDATGEGFTVKGRLDAPPHVSMPRDVRVVVNGGLATTLVRRDGTFAVSGLAPGVYSVEFLTTKIMFPRFKVNLNAEGEAKAVQYSFPGAAHTSAQYPLRVKPVSTPQYFEPRPRVNFIGMIMKNPMILMMMFSMGIMFLPKLLGKMDPEAMKQYEEMQQQMGGQGDLMGMLKSAMNGEDPTAPKPREERGKRDAPRRAKRTILAQ